MSRTGLALALAGAAAFVPRPGAATVVKSLTLFEKCQIAPVIALVEVERVEPSWEIEGGSVKTLITMRVVQPLKGGFAIGERLLVRQGGGKIGSFEHRIPGMSPYEPGERAVLFLETLGPYFVEIGIGIGKYGVDGPERNQWVTHDPKVALMRVSRDRPMQAEEPGPMIPERLEEFLKRVRTYVAGIQTPTGATKKKALLRPVLPDPR